MWDYDELVRTARAGLRRYSLASVVEQAVHGVDALSELELHPLLAAEINRLGFGVKREWPYPGVPEKRPKFSARARCDLVLTSTPGLELMDPVAELLETDKAAGTLFEPVIERATATRPARRCLVSEAFWMEVKVVGQHTYTQGVPGPNRAYASELMGSLNMDLAKIAADPALQWAGLLLVLFTDEPATAEHDLMLALHKSLDRGHSFKSPHIETFAIPDRIGNRTCSVALVPR